MLRSPLALLMGLRFWVCEALRVCGVSQHLGCSIKFIILLVECVLPFVRGLVLDRSVQLVVVAPVHPFHAPPVDLCGGFHGP